MFHNRHLLLVGLRRFDARVNKAVKDLDDKVRISTIIVMISVVAEISG
jgi:hypothetical protein